MKIIRLSISIFISLATALGIKAQETQTPEAKTNTIALQFEELLDNSNNYQDYKVVKTKALIQLRSNTQDSLSEFKNQITSLNKKIGDQEAQMNVLNKNLDETKQKLDDSIEEKNSIYFFGAPMSKGAYMAMMWSVVCILALALLFFILKFRGSNTHTQEARQKLAELDLEYDNFRKKALEKEQKMGRLLQDERNKSVKNPKK